MTYKYVYQEYPKALYRFGEYTAVANAEEEAVARADGFMTWGDDHDRDPDINKLPFDDEPEVVDVAPKRRGRPPKE